MKRRKKFGLAGSLAVGAVASLNSTALADDWFVDASAGSGGNGAGWTAPDVPFQTLEEALDNPQLGAGDRIFVADGIYKPGASRQDRFVMVAGVIVEGGYAGISDPTADPDPILYPTILSGDIGTLNDPTDNCYHVVVFDNEQMDSTPQGQFETKLDGVTITGGYAWNEFLSGPTVGAGILIDNGASPRIHNCKITGNYATDGGAGIAIRRDTGLNPSSAVITACVISNNIGGYYDALSFVARAGSGAGIQMRGDGHLELQNCTLSNNSANVGGNGGAVFIGMSDTSANPTATIVNCLIHDNIAQGSPSVQFDAGLGGGICVQGNFQTPADGPVVNIFNCTIAENTAIEGGGVDVNKTGSDTTTMKGCIVRGNTVDPAVSTPVGKQLAMKDGAFVVRYSDIMEKDLISEHVQQGIDLGDPDTTNIGDDATADYPDFINASADDFRIDCGSPCINVGNSAGFPTDTYDVNQANGTTELVPTLQLLNRVQGSQIDMGAYERINLRAKTSA